MRIRDFPHCCTAKIIVDFGESDVAEGGAWPVTQEEIESYILGKIERYSQPFYGYATLVATTNNEQKTANKVLLKLGFKHSTWMSKKAHKNTKVRLWWYPLEREANNGER